MAKEINVQETIQSDFSVVVNDIAEELLTRLNMDEDGSVIDMFQTLQLNHVLRKKVTFV